MEHQSFTFPSHTSCKTVLWLLFVAIVDIAGVSYGSGTKKLVKEFLLQRVLSDYCRDHFVITKGSQQFPITAFFTGAERFVINWGIYEGIKPGGEGEWESMLSGTIYKGSLNGTHPRNSIEVVETPIRDIEFSWFITHDPCISTSTSLDGSFCIFILLKPNYHEQINLQS